MQTLFFFGGLVFLFLLGVGIFSTSIYTLGKIILNR